MKLEKPSRWTHTNFLTSQKTSSSIHANNDKKQKSVQRDLRGIYDLNLMETKQQTFKDLFAVEILLVNLLFLFQFLL